MPGTLIGASAANLAPPGPGPAVAREQLGLREGDPEYERTAVEQPPTT